MKFPALVSLLCLPSVARQATAQDDGAAPAPAPPAAQIGWQRSLEDALWMSRQTGRPLLICVNMDGEVFCERFAGETYRDPDFVALTDGYVPLIVSPNRHTERDYDHAGRRVPCPRFGEITCSEHIAIEPELFERWFNGQRAAPRHLGVSLEGEVLFDRFLDRSMQTAIDAIAEHRVAGVDLPPLPRAIAALLQRRDADARIALESAYLVAGDAVRRVLLDAAKSSTAQPTDLLRMGLREQDPALFAAAAEALAATATEAELIDVEDALARAESEPLRGLLLTALGRLAEESAPARRRAAFLAAVDAGLEWAHSEPWRSATEMAPAAPVAVEGAVLDREIERLDEALAEAPNDAGLRLQRARALLLFAEGRIAQGKDPTFFLHDARSDGERAERSGTRGGLDADALAVQAWASWLLGETGRAAELGARAIAAMVEAGTDYDAANPLAARALEATGKGALSTVYDAVQADPEAVPADALQTAAGALAALAGHPYGTEALLLDYTGLLEFAGARREARVVLRAGLQRHATSPRLHEAFRNRVIVDLGADSLVPVYSELVSAAETDAAALSWFGGYAALVAAEVHVRSERPDAARAAYDRALAWFERSAELEPGYADSAHHFAVLALAGRAHLDAAAGELTRAAEDLLRAAALRPASLRDSDGLGRKPIDLVQRLQQLLDSRGETELAARLAVLAQG